MRRQASTCRRSSDLSAVCTDKVIKRLRVVRQQQGDAEKMTGPLQPFRMFTAILKSNQSAAIWSCLLSVVGTGSFPQSTRIELDLNNLGTCLSVEEVTE